MNLKVNADPQMREKFLLSETIPEDKVDRKVCQINASGVARAFVEGSQLVILQLFVD